MQAVSSWLRLAKSVTSFEAGAGTQTRPYRGACRRGLAPASMSARLFSH
jgi:hypothetical protein